MRKGNEEYQALYEAIAQIQDNQYCFGHEAIYTTATKIHNWQSYHRGVSKQFNSRHHLLHTVLLIPTQTSQSTLTSFHKLQNFHDNKCY